MTQPKDFGYGVEEQLLQAEARKFFKKQCDELKLMELVADNPDPDREPECQWDEKIWKKMAELGWTTMAVPESAGGMGMSTVAVATLVEEAGRAALPSPLVASINATYVLAACGTENATAVLGQIAEDQTASLAITDKSGSWESSDTDVAATGDGTVTLDGTAWYVQDARKVDFFVVKAKSQAGIGLYRVPVDASGVTIVPDSIVDLTRDQAHVRFEGVEVAAENVVAEPGQGNKALDAAMPAILTVVSADMCGAAEWQLQTTTEYAKNRVQFDHPIGFFQAVKHPIVNMMIMIDSARSLVYNAACAIDHEPENADRYAHMAKASASDMAAFCSGRAVQYHGGMGFTWECFVHLYFKRQIHNQILYGDAAYHRAKLADMLMGPIAA
ncbi:MAG: acyl-CoA/acyl-ACP dehydrogenase [Proteobacteria bacterium]|nr:acyl-CoA/acyl-ACP dehydrogenase [Pseudomonadota bacterium]